MIGVAVVLGMVLAGGRVDHHSANQIAYLGLVARVMMVVAMARVVMAGVAMMAAAARRFRSIGGFARRHRIRHFFILETHTL
jgi:hypothetical protein